MKIIPQVSLFYIVSCCLFSPVQAELQLASISADDFLGDMPVVLSATRLSQPLRDVPEAMTVLDRRTIEASGAQTIPDVLRLVPGFQVGQVNGSRATATYHGFSDRFARNMEVLVDGRSVYDAGYGLVAWADLPLALEDIERIEVMRGPNAAAHGANAFSATINIITYHPLEQQGVSTNVTRGNPDSNKVLMSYAAVVDDFEYRISARYDDNRGIETRYDDSRTRMISFRGDYQLDTRDSLFMALGASEGERDDGFGRVPTDDPFDVYQPERTVEDNNSFQQLRWTRSLSVDNEYSIQLYHNHQHISDDFETVLFSEFDAALPTAIQLLFGQDDQRLKLGYGLDSHRYDLELQHKLRLTDTFRLAWGMGVRVDSSSDFASYGSDKVFSRQQSRLFINAEWFALPQLVLNTGVMVEKVEDLSSQWMPRLAANYHINNNHTLRFSISDAIRIPTLLEDHANLYARFQDGAVFDYVSSGPDNLKPEELRSVELGYIANFPQLGLSWDLKFYRDRLENRINNPKDKTCLETAEADNSAGLGNVCDFFASQGVEAYRGAFITGNHSDAEIEGYEVGLNWDLTDTTWLRAAYAYADAVTVEPDNINPLELRTKYDYVPDLTYSLLLAHRFPQDIQLSAAYYHMDELDWAGEGNNIPAYHRLDMRLAKTFKLAKLSGKLALVMQNMQDEYLDFQDENIMRKRSYVSLDLFFH